MLALLQSEDTVCPQAGSELTDVGVEFAAQDQKNATQVL